MVTLTVQGFIESDSEESYNKQLDAIVKSIEGIAEVSTVDVESEDEEYDENNEDDFD